MVQRGFWGLYGLALVGFTRAGSIVVGDVKVAALSPTLLRIEPKGPTGFEDRATFNVVGRDSFAGGLDLTVLNKSAEGTWLTTSAYNVFLPSTHRPAAACDASPMEHTDVKKPFSRSAAYPNGTLLPVTPGPASEKACCAICAATADCVGWVVTTDGETSAMCWPFADITGGIAAVDKGRAFGWGPSGRGSGFAAAVVTTHDGEILFDASKPQKYTEVAPNELHWPSPHCKGCGGTPPQTAYAFTDHPRFTVPEWGPTPIPEGANVPPELVSTNGYDFTNDISSDTYIFLLGADGGLDQWWASRAEFMTLTGPTPLLPDYAFGVWYTWYLVYTEQRAKDEVGNWTAIDLPLDVWGLDMNWRNIGAGKGSDLPDPASVSTCRTQTDSAALPTCRSHFYDSPNLRLLPGLANPNSTPAGANEWFGWLKSKKLRTYFNDHPFPVANQTTPEEVAFRFNGLSEWIGRGLSYWWFDHNWGFTVPGPRMPLDTKDPYEGMSGQVWGSQIYYESTRVAYTQHNITARPIALSRDNGPNWRAEDIPGQCLSGAGSPAHHRFPVWWTGDGVPLMGSVGSMVDEAVHDFRSFVHSDCGGHGSCAGVAPPRTPGQPPPPPPENVPCPGPTNSGLLRWTAHCTFGTIMRFHQGDHRFWLRSQNTQDSARRYLNMRYKLAPSLIAAGRTVQTAGFPLTARADLIWSEYPEANDPTQYIHLNASLIAPLEGDTPSPDLGVSNNVSSRSVWIPPGDWQDGWTGKMVTGPKTMTVTPTESEGKFNIPMWHKAGAVVVIVSDGKQRINSQDWTELTIEAFPSATPDTAIREIFEQDFTGHADDAVTRVELHTDGAGRVAVNIGAGPATLRGGRAWVVRLHLRVGKTLVLDPDTAPANVVASLVHLKPNCEPGYDHFPFLGAGARPACSAGVVAEFRLPASSAAQQIKAMLV